MDKVYTSPNISLTPFREGVINIPGEGVYQFGALRAPNADPPHFWLIPSRPPPKFSNSVYTPPKSPSRKKFFRENFSDPPKKKQNSSKFSL